MVERHEPHILAHTDLIHWRILEKFETTTDTTLTNICANRQRDDEEHSYSQSPVIKTPFRVATRQSSSYSHEISQDSKTSYYQRSISS